MPKKGDVDTPDLCDCESYEHQTLSIEGPNPDGNGRIYQCVGGGFNGVMV